MSKYVALICVCQRPTTVTVCRNEKIMDSTFNHRLHRTCWIFRKREREREKILSSGPSMNDQIRRSGKKMERNVLIRQDFVRMSIGFIISIHCFCSITKLTFLNAINCFIPASIAHSSIAIPFDERYVFLSVCVVLLIAKAQLREQ